MVEYLLYVEFSVIVCIELFEILLNILFYIVINLIGKDKWMNK